MVGRSVVHRRAVPCGVRGPSVSCSRSRASSKRERVSFHGKGSSTSSMGLFGRVAARAAEDSLSPLSPSSSDSPAVDGAIPEEVQVMFKEAQQRILDLNQSRLHALEELAEARAKIIDLEERLSQAEKDAMGMTMAVAQEAAAAAAPLSLPQQGGGGEAAAPATPPPANSPPPAVLSPSEAAAALSEVVGDDDGAGKTMDASAGVISLLYETSWEPAFIHFNCPEFQSWTDSPGMKMKAGELPNHKIFSITASNLEFVLNDGGSEWDKPSYDANYFIGSPGSYILKKGKLEKVR